jgi:NADH dehydrogenase/NADH:ubiquinone oxidoreductase subunit G
MDVQEELVSLVTFTIDDREVTALAGMTVLEAANQAGVRIPHLCSDSRLARPAHAALRRGVDGDG